MKISYDWMKTFFKEDALPPAEEVSEKLIFGAFEIEGVEKIGNDYVLDADVLPNRTSDCLSHRGIAHEVSALFDIKLARDPLREAVVLEPRADELFVSVQKDSSCTYYGAALLKGVEVKDSPDWLKRRLGAIGQKSINNVVDATNYVMFELGQPLHAFDASKLKTQDGRSAIGVRVARGRESITLLGEEMPRELGLEMTVITDTNADVPLAIAGVKGGVHAEVDSGTTAIVLESARFDPVATRKTSQALKLRTDASARFENDIPDRLPAVGLQVATSLILEIAGGTLAGFACDGEAARTNPAVAVLPKEVNALLGADIPEKEMLRIFDRLEFAYEAAEDGYTVTAPFERLDVRIPEDIAEEVGRLYGYTNIKSKPLPNRDSTMVVNKEHYFSERIRVLLTEAGFTEVFTYSLVDKGDVALANAFASDKDHVRTDLKTGMLEALKKNEPYMPLLGLYEAVRIFEIGKIFKTDREELHLCIGVRVAENKKREPKTREELEKGKWILEQVFGAGTIPEPDGEILECDVGALIEKMDSPKQYEDVPTIAEGIAYQPLSPYPFVLRDIAFWAPEGTGVKESEEVIRAHASGLLVRCDLFDTFIKEGRASYAFHLVFQSHEKTLSDEEVNKVMEKVEKVLVGAGFAVR